MCSEVDMRTKEVVAGKVIHNIQQQGSDNDNIFTLRTQGPRPLRLQICSSKPTTPHVSANDLFELQRNMNCSNNTMRSFIVTFIRKKYGRKSIPSNVDSLLTNRDSQLRSFFATERVTDGDGDFITLVYCTDVMAFIEHVVSSRALFHPQAKIGIDGGAGFFKVCLTIWDSQRLGESESSHLSGVKRTFIIAISPTLKEKYHNLKTVLDKLQIDEIDFAHTYSVDLKVANLLCGIQSHGCTYPCVFCECPKSDFSNTTKASSYAMRTFGSIRQNALNYQIQKRVNPQTTARDFKSCIHEPLICAEENTIIFQSITLSELHLLLRITNKLFNEFEKKHAQVANAWIQSIGISRPKLHSGEFNGNTCRKILTHVDFISSESGEDDNVEKFKEAFKTFNKVVTSCFGMDLASDFHDHIEKFEMCLIKLGITISTSMHIVIQHVNNFCQFHHCSLGIFSEQATEAIHYDFQAMWQHGGKVSDSHPQYGSHLLQSVVCYNGRHL